MLRDDLDVAEVHDCFAVTELMMYEAIGLAEPGKGAEFFRSGATRLGGRIPVNTGGGLLSFGHPVGATGVKQVLEIYRQMKGKCGDYQMEQRPQLGPCPLLFFAPSAPPRSESGCCGPQG